VFAAFVSEAITTTRMMMMMMHDELMTLCEPLTNTDVNERHCRHAWSEATVILSFNWSFSG
jgi:hypothetical protein